MDFVGSFFHFDLKSVVPRSSRTLSRTPLISRMNSQVETTLSNAQISALRPQSVLTTSTVCPDDSDRDQSAL